MARSRSLISTKARANADPIVLVHGFASTKEMNWVNPGWVTTLTRAGRRVIALDNRGHGASSKLYDPADYHTAKMADDVRALLDHLVIERADVMGYSMGARITAFLAVEHPARVRSAVLGGLGIRLVDGVGLPDEHRRRAGGAVARRRHRSDRAAYSAPSPSRPGPTSRRWPPASAARVQVLSREQVGAIGIPVLVAVGTKDDVAGSGPALAALIPGAQALDIPGPRPYAGGRR